MSFGASHEFLGDLHGDAGVAALIAPAQMLAHMRAVELAYIAALVAAGRVDSAQGQRIAAAIETVAFDMGALRSGSLRDGVVVPALVAQLRAGLNPEDAAVLHKGLTSQDVVDTALSMALARVCDLMAQRLDCVTGGLAALTDRFGTAALMGRTRHQAALEVTVAHRIAQWAAPFATLKSQLSAMGSALHVLQLGGPVGLACGLGDDIATHMAQRLGLHVAPAVWHTNRHGVVGFGDWLSHVTGATGKIGRDVTLMAQQGIAEITLSGSGGSSAMAHKQNPILAETLVTFAQFNATQLGGLHQALLHEQERSGVAWALEWMVLPLMIETTGAALRHTEALLGSVTGMGDAKIL